MRIGNKRLVGVGLLGAVLLLIGSPAMAAMTGDADALGTGVCEIVNILTGKWLFGFSILATLGAGAALLFGGEITDGLKKVATIISVVGIILISGALLAKVFAVMGNGGMSC